MISTSAVIRGALVAAIATLGTVPAAVAAETNLVFATLNPPQADTNRLQLHPWADAINKRGGDIIHIDIRDGSAIVDHANFYNRVLDDVIQIGYGSQSYIGGRFSRSEVVTLPFGAETTADGSQAFWQLYASGLLDAEYSEIQPLALFLFPQHAVHLAKAPASPADLSGLKLVISGRVSGQVASTLGAAPLSLNAQDIYFTLKRGMADGVLSAWTSLEVFKLPEVTHYHIDTPLGASPSMVFMAKKKYRALPEAARKILDEGSGEMVSRAMGQSLDDQQRDELTRLKAEPGQVIVDLTQAQTSAWRAKVQTVIDTWLRETPGSDAVLTKYNALLAKLEPDRAG